MAKKPILLIIIASILMVPMVYGLTIDGPTNFQSSGGGNVRYQLTPIVSQINIINTLTRFNRLRLGGVNMGNLGFDCDTGVNMTVTGINHNTVTYLIETGAGPAVDSYIYYRRDIGLNQLTSPASVTGGTWTYNDGTDVLTVTTLGASVPVIVTYGMDVSSPLLSGSTLIWTLIPFLALTIGIGDYRNEEFGQDTLMKIVLMGTIIAFFAWLFGTWGY